MYNRQVKSAARLGALGLLAGLSVVACDAQVPAGAATAAAGPTAAASGGSRVFETCAATRDCDDGLRCLDQMCLPAQRSTLGDLQAASGASLLRNGGTDAAIAAYAEALARYDAEHVAVPADIDCGYGQALLADRGKPERAELAAKVLHRCVLATPAGSAPHVAALGGLAELLPLGLDPAQVAKATPADLYLTKAAAAVPVPSAAAVKVTVGFEPAPPARSAPALQTRLTDTDVDAALRGCFASWTGVTRQPSLRVSLPVRSKALPNDYDDEPTRYAFTVEPMAATTSPDGLATTCVRAAIEAAGKKVAGLRDGYTGQLVVSIQ